MRKIYLVPNLCTTGNFFCGLMSMTLTIREEYSIAAWLILLAMVFDFLDGYLARLTRSISRFGVEYDSLADLTTFGLAPALLIYRAFLLDMGRLGIGAAFLFSVSAALRLARFNVQFHGEEKHEFRGLPTPAAAGVMATLILLVARFSIDPSGWLPVLMILLSYLMLSTVRFAALSRIEVYNRKPFIYLALIILCFVAIIFYAEAFFFLGFTGYVGFNLYRNFFHPRRAVSLGIEKTKEIPHSD